MAQHLENRFVENSYFHLAAKAGSAFIAGSHAVGCVAGPISWASVYTRVVCTVPVRMDSTVATQLKFVVLLNCEVENWV
jgi:hypothetical protein